MHVRGGGLRARRRRRDRAEACARSREPSSRPRRQGRARSRTASSGLRGGSRWAGGFGRRRLSPVRGDPRGAVVGARPGASVHRAPGRSRGGAGAGDPSARSRAARARRQAPHGPRRVRRRHAWTARPSERRRRPSARGWWSRSRGTGFASPSKTTPRSRRSSRTGSRGAATRCGPRPEPKLTGKEQHEFAAGRHFGPGCVERAGHGGPSRAARPHRRRSPHVAASIARALSSSHRDRDAAGRRVPARARRARLRRSAPRARGRRPARPPPGLAAAARRARRAA